MEGCGIYSKVLLAARRQLCEGSSLKDAFPGSLLPSLQIMSSRYMLLTSLSFLFPWPLALPKAKQNDVTFLHYNFTHHNFEIISKFKILIWLQAC